MLVLKQKEVTVKGVDCIVKIIRYKNNNKVRRAVCKDTGRLVAVKFLRPRMNQKVYNSIVLPKKPIKISSSIYEL